MGSCFQFFLPTEHILQTTTNFLSQNKFNGESEIPSLDHLFKFINRCISRKITDKGALCKLFTLTFKSQIKKWFYAFTTESIHSWELFMELFLIVHKSYDYEVLCKEIQSLNEEEDEFIGVFYSNSLSHIYSLVNLLSL